MPARWSFSARRRCESTAFPSAATDTRQRRSQSPDLLRELATQLDSGRIYLRDLRDLGAALSAALAAYERHPSASDQGMNPALPAFLNPPRICATRLASTRWLISS